MRVPACAWFVTSVLLIPALACEPPTVPPGRVATLTPGPVPAPDGEYRGWSDTDTSSVPPPPVHAPMPQTTTPAVSDAPVVPSERDALGVAPNGETAGGVDDKMAESVPAQGAAAADSAVLGAAETGRDQRTKGPRRERPPGRPASPAPVVVELARALEEQEFESIRLSAPPPVEQIFRQEKARFQRCYDALVLRDPATLPGSLSVRLVLGPAGDIRQAEFVSGTLEDPDFRDCIMTKLTALSFPRNDAVLDFTYPFRFGAPGGEGSVE